jgi:hypothetical protein
MALLAADDPRAYFTVVAACGASQICITADRGGFKNADRVYQLSEFLFNRWRAANVDGHSPTSEWVEALQVCERQRASYFSFAKQFNCAMAMMKPHDGSDLAAALRTVGCGDAQELQTIGAAISRCFLIPGESLGGTFKLRRALNATFNSTCPP